MFIRIPTTESIIHSVSGAASGKEQAFLILLGEKSTVSIPEMIAGLNAHGIVFFGGIFPGVIHGTEYCDSGAVVIRMPILRAPTVVRNLDSTTEIPEFSPEYAEVGSKYTALVLVDGLTKGISPFIQNLFDRFGNFVNYLGGGAGSLSLNRAPCLFANDGFFQDAAVVAFVRLKSALGVQHGWRKLTGPLVATRTDGNVISELNWESPLDIYRQIVEADSGRSPGKDDFFSVSMGYPFGIMKEETEDIVRDPIAVRNGEEIICIGEIPENAVLNILKGNKRHLIEAAGRAADQCLEQCSVGEQFHCLVFDCISRVLYLEEAFSQELHAIQERVHAKLPETDVAGVLSLGEISSYGEGYLELFNKTAVVGILYQ